MSIDLFDSVLDVVVVGAGVSGMSTADQLRKLNASEFVVLDARDCVGGRTYTVRNPNAHYVDLGGAYVGVTQSHLHRVIRDLGLRTYKVDESRNILFYDFDTGFRRTFSHNSNLRIGNWIENLDLNHFLRRLDEIGETINVREPWNTPNAKELDQITYNEFVQKTCWTAKARRFAKFFINLNVTCEPYEGSLLWFAWYVRQCGGIRRIISTTGGGQESKVEGGTMQISELLSKRVGDHKVHLSNPVHRVVYDQTADQILQALPSDQRPDLASKLSNKLGSYCLVQTLSGRIYVCRKVVLAMPPIMQNKIHFYPPLPPLRNQLIQRQPMGAVIKFIIYYDQRFWNEQSKFI